jgi:MbtH protein
MNGRAVKGVCEMAFEDGDDRRTYVVLINAEEQYSLWLQGKKIPEGWRAVGKEGSKDECMKFVDEAWSDMRPLSLRLRMDAAGGGTPTS